MRLGIAVAAVGLLEGPARAAVLVAGTEALVAQGAAGTLHVLVGPVEYHILAQLALQVAVEQRVGHRGVQPDEAGELLVVGDEPGLIAAKHLLELLPYALVEACDVVGPEPLAIGRIGDHIALLGSLLQLAQVLLPHLDHLAQAGTLHVGLGYGHSLHSDVAAIYLVVKLPLARVVVVDFAVQLGVVVAPALKRKVVAVHAGVDVGSNQGCLDQEGARAAHGVDQIALAVPPAELDDAGGQHLVDGGIGLRHAPAALVERLARRVERERDLVARDVHVETQVGRVEPYRGPAPLGLHKVVGNGVFHTIGDKSRVAEALAVYRRVDGKRVGSLHDRAPVEALHFFIEVVGIGRAELVDGLEHAQCRVQAEVGAIHHLFVASEGDHALALLHILGAQLLQLVAQYALQTLEGLGHHFKIFTHRVDLFLFR